MQTCLFDCPFFHALSCLLGKFIQSLVKIAVQLSTSIYIEIDIMVRRLVINNPLIQIECIDITIKQMICYSLAYCSPCLYLITHLDILFLEFIRS